MPSGWSTSVRGLVSKASGSAGFIGRHAGAGVARVGSSTGGKVGRH